MQVKSFPYLAKTGLLEYNASTDSSAKYSQGVVDIMGKSLEEIYGEVKIGLRLVIVIITWFIVVVVPDTSKSFFQSLFIVSITAAYEYTVMYIESRDGLSRGIAKWGVFLSTIYFLFSLLGLFGLVHLNVTDMDFNFDGKFPIPNAAEVSWSYYFVVIPVLAFPGLIAIQLINLPAKGSVVSK